MFQLWSNNYLRCCSIAPRLYHCANNSGRAYDNYRFSYHHPDKTQSTKSKPKRKGAHKFRVSSIVIIIVTCAKPPCLQCACVATAGTHYWRCSAHRRGSSTGLAQLFKLFVKICKQRVQYKVNFFFLFLNSSNLVLLSSKQQNRQVQ